MDTIEYSKKLKYIKLFENFNDNTLNKFRGEGVDLSDIFSICEKNPDGVIIFQYSGIETKNINEILKSYENGGYKNEFILCDKAPNNIKEKYPNVKIYNLGEEYKNFDWGIYKNKIHIYNTIQWHNIPNQ